MPSFDVELKVDAVELKNAVDQAQKEIGTRYDFRGTAAAVEQKDLELTLIAESDFQLRQVRDVLIGKLAKRGVDVRFLDESKAVEKIGGDKLKQTIVVKSGIDKDLGKKIQTTVKNAKALKLSASLQATSCASRAPSATPCRNASPFCERKSKRLRSPSGTSAIDHVGRSSLPTCSPAAVRPPSAPGFERVPFVFFVSLKIRPDTTFPPLRQGENRFLPQSVSVCKKENFASPIRTQET